MSWLTLDIGGANLKAADGRRWAKVAPFELWRNPTGLTAALVAIINAAPVAERIAVTMTGELCDCFVTKTDGVRHILACVAAAAGQRDVAVYLVDGRFVAVDEARELTHLAAASNWHALASFACRYVDGDVAVLIDIGSTTTDIIPLVDGQPRPHGWNDTDRLLAGELVYTGVGRTPICAITHWLPWRGQRCPVAAELFATAADAYVILERIAEQPYSTTTADGRPLTKEFAQARLARMICVDPDDFDAADAQPAAEQVQQAQLLQLERAFHQVIAHVNRPPRRVIISGSGEFVARRLAATAAARPQVLPLSERLSRPVSLAATAHALAVLASEKLGPAAQPFGTHGFRNR